MAKRPVKRPEPARNIGTLDSYANFQARVGNMTGNMGDGGMYLQTRRPSDLRAMLDDAYRTSWMAGVAVDAVPDDATREGITFNIPGDNGDSAMLNAGMERLQIWNSINESWKWGRLYGGCIGVLMIEGQAFETPLNLNSIAEGQFKGIYPIDRWSVIPDQMRLVREFGPNFGKPEFYRVMADARAMMDMTIHYSRVIRFGGVPVPYRQSLQTMLWDQSILERVFDRLLAFDSTSTGIAQLVYKAHLRTLSVKDLRNLIAQGGNAFEGLLKHVEMIRRFQSNEGLTLMDTADSFETHTYNFAGLDDILEKMGEQVSGALGIPMTRLYGQAPGGLKTGGDGDMHNYFDNVKRQQDRNLRPGLNLIVDLLHRSELGTPPPDGFGYEFNPLYQPTDVERGEALAKKSGAIIEAYDKGLITQQTALIELRALAPQSGVFGSITDKQVADADEELPDPADVEPEDATLGDPDDKAGGAE